MINLSADPHRRIAFPNQEIECSAESIDSVARNLIEKISSLSSYILLEKTHSLSTEPKRFASDFNVKTTKEPQITFGSQFKAFLKTIEVFPVIDYERAAVMPWIERHLFSASLLKAEKQVESLRPFLSQGDQAKISHFTSQCQTWIRSRNVEAIFHELETCQDEKRKVELLGILEKLYEGGSRIRMGYAEGEVTKRVVSGLVELGQADLVVAMSRRRWLHPRYTVYALSSLKKKEIRKWGIAARDQILNTEQLLSDEDVKAFINMANPVHDELVAKLMELQGRRYLQGLKPKKARKIMEKFEKKECDQCYAMMKELFPAEDVAMEFQRTLDLLYLCPDAVIDDFKEGNSKVNMADEEGNTLFMHCVIDGHFDLAEEIYDLGGDPYYENMAGDTPYSELMEASRQEDQNANKLLNKIDSSFLE